MADDHTRTELKKVASDPGTDPTYAAPSAPSAPSLAPADADRYERGREIARGGMGRIVAARDRRLGRPVAIKELIAPDPGLASRFEREALITARLQHPSIVSLYEAGLWPSGEPFYAMKLVAGRSFKEVIEATSSRDERLALLPTVIAIADALAYAHGQRVIHRDLKPANVLVGDFGETVVIDWGLAKDLNQTEEEVLPATAVKGSSGSSRSLTVVGSVMGTPAFMSPEQAHGDPVDERSDVYAIGAILYHLLSGAQPYSDRGTSDLLAGVLEGPPTPLAPPVPPELIAIVGRAMARRPDDRYPSARELAEELRRFQTGKLVAAHQYTRGQLFRRWIRRNRTALTVAAAVAGAAAVTGGVSIYRIIRERERAEAAEASATSRADRLTVSEARAALGRDPLRTLALLAELGPRSRQWGAGRMLAADAIARGLPRILRGPAATQTVLASGAAGRRLASGGSDGAVWLWDAGKGTGRELYRHAREIGDIVFSPDGSQLVSCSGDGAIQLWDGAQARVLVENGAPPQDVAFSPDGAALFVSTTGGMQRYALAAGGAPTLLPLPEIGRFLDVSPDGKYLAASGFGTNVMLHDLETGQTRVLAGHTDPVQGLAFAPGSQWLVSGGADGTVRLWSVADGLGRVLGRHEGGVNAVAYSPDGKLVASGGADRVVRLWTVATGEGAQLSGSTEAVAHVGFSPDGARVAASGKETSVRIWPVTGGPARALSVENVDPSIALLEGGALAAIAGTPEVRVWDAATPAPVLGELSTGFAPLPDGRRVVIVDVRGDASVWDLAGGERLARLPGNEGPLERVTASPDGKTFATLATSGEVRLWDVERGAQAAALPGFAAGPIVFSPDGRWVAAPAKLETSVLVWEVKSGAGRAFAGHEGWIYDLAFSPDGRELASASGDQTVRLWDLEGQTVRTLAGHTATVDQVAYAPGGRWIASASSDRTVRLWDLERGATRVERVDTTARGLVFSPDGATLAAGDGKLLHLWSTAGGEGRVLAGQSGRIARIVFSPDGLAVATSDRKGVRLWDVAGGEARTVAAVEGNAFIEDVAWGGDTLVVMSARTLQLFRDDLPRAPEALRARLAALIPPGR